MKPYLIIWRDASNHDQHPWFIREELVKFAKEDAVIHSFGFLVCEEKDYLVLAADMDDESENFGRVMKIPTANVIRKRRL